MRPRWQEILFACQSVISIAASDNGLDNMDEQPLASRFWIRQDGSSRHSFIVAAMNFLPFQMADYLHFRQV
jgi:hypothetical protein